MKEKNTNSVDRHEIAHFSADSEHWWAEEGSFSPLHRLNPVRLDYIKTQICGHFTRDINDLKAYRGLSILDIGCGGGLVCEPMARLGAAVTGIDADEKAVEVAKNHAATRGLAITYHAGAPETAPLLKGGYDVVLALEVIEHVTDPRAFVQTCLAHCKKGGLLIFSTLNRTPAAMILGKIAAEYVLGWVPRGTHDWRKFVRPSELARFLRDGGAIPLETKGIVFNPLRGHFALKPDVSVNYFLCAAKPHKKA
jgi:2-polyprenyl-6-hydroxyphenyl methylase/3-demethylubiquinone-9 3-methyltransferase